MISVAAVALASGLLFGLHRSGTLNLEPFPGPIVAVGLISFDGNGNNTVVQDTSRNGNFVFGSPGDGGYEVAEDYSGKFL
jgi:hypothetical protein